MRPGTALGFRGELLISETLTLEVRQTELWVNDIYNHLRNQIVGGFGFSFDAACIYRLLYVVVNNALFNTDQFASTNNYNHLP